MDKILYISAGAGSGKTTKIVNMLVDILKNNKDIKTSNIMMTTFSRAAAFEMREKTRQGLLKEGLVDKASELDAASIGTIHSVCLKFLKKYWYHAHISPEPRQLEENDFKLFADKSINKLVSDNDIQQFENWRKVLGLTKGLYSEDDTTYWRDLLKTMVQKVRYYNITNLTESRTLSKEAIEQCFANHRFDQVTYDSMKKEYLEENGKDVKNGGKLTANAQKRETAIKNYNPVREGFENFPSSNAACIKNISREMELFVKSELIFTDEKRDVLIAIEEKLFDILKQWIADFDTFKKENHLLDYNDMELLFKDLLGNEEVREDIENQYKLIMVDEFQDCNTIQVDIFKQLSDLVAKSSPLPSSSIWVGDPKQAIYGFRGSDTELTKSIGDEIHNNEDNKVRGFNTEALEYSFRSRKGLVDFANKIFLPIFKSRNFNMIEKEITLQAGRLPGKMPSDDIDPNQKALLQWEFSKGNEEDRSFALAERIKSTVEAGKYKVQSKKDGTVNPLQYKDIAVLCRSNTAVSNVANSMLELGIPVCAPEADIFSRIEVQLALALMQYAKKPARRRHLRFDIIHLLKNESTEDILNEYVKFIQGKVKTETGESGHTYKCFPEWRNDDELIQLVETISKECYAKNMHDTLATFVDRLRLFDVVNRWGSPEIRKDNITNLLQQAARYDTHCEQMGQKDDQQKFSTFVQYLIDNSTKTEQDLDRDAVKVITYHKSKGLDWPMVVLYELNNKNFDTAKIVKREFCGVKEQKKIGGGYWLRVFPPMGKMIDKDGAEILSEEPYFDTVRSRTLKEETRLLYVGVTRARDILVFATELSVAKKETKIKTDWLNNIVGAENEGIGTGELLTLLTNEEDSTKDGKKTVVSTSNKYQEIDITKLTAKVASQKHLVNPSTVKIPAATYSDIQVIDIPGAQFSVNRPEEVRMSTIGTCIHNIYAAYNPDILENEPEKMAGGIINAYGLNGVIAAQGVIQAIRLLYQKLEEMFGKAESIGHEIPFRLPMADDQLLHGEIDLLWESGNNEVILIDFKNIESETPNPDHYFSQMAAYEKAIETAKLNCKAIVLFYANHGKMVVLKKR